MTTSDKNDYLEKTPILKLLMRFSVPCIISLLVSALYNIVDQIFIGQGVGYLANAATNVVYPFTVIALAFSLLIGDGCAAFFSISLGRKEKKAGDTAAGNGILLLIAAGVVLMLFGFLFEDNILNLFGVTPASYGYARKYLSIILIGFPFYVFTSGANSIIRADGSPHYAMISTVIGAVINLILDPVAIFALHLGVSGAAFATIIGQIVSCIVTGLYFRRPKTLALDKKTFRPHKTILAKSCSLGISSFITQLAIVLVIGVANNMFVLYGGQSKFGADIPLSVVGIVMKVFSIVIAVVVGIAVGGQPIVGYNYGAGRYARVRETYRQILISVSIVGVISMLLFELCPQSIIALFGSENALYNEFAVLCFRIFLSGILLCSIQKASSIFLQSIGKPVQSMLLSLSRDVFFLIPGIIILPVFYGVTGILWAAPIADVLSILLTVFFISAQMRKLKKPEHAQA